MLSENFLKFISYQLASKPRVAWAVCGVQKGWLLLVISPNSVNKSILHIMPRKNITVTQSIYFLKKNYLISKYQFFVLISTHGFPC